MKLTMIPALIAVAALSACAAPTADNLQTPITEFNGHSVKVQVPVAAEYMAEAEQKKLAARVKSQTTQVCKTAGFNDAGAVSQQTIYQVYGSTRVATHYEYLLICK